MKTKNPQPGSLSRKRERDPFGGFTPIAAATGMGAVEVAVTDGDRALRFYRDYVGLTPMPSPDSAIRLGAGARELVVLHPGAERPVVPRTSGLYHFAILVPDRRELARVIARLGRLGWDQYPTDHVMTNASHVPGVGFVSAGGYHHHLGLNTWAGRGARPAPPGSAGLLRFTVELPARPDLEDVVGRLEHGDVSLTEEAGGFAVVDPSANRVLF